MKRIIGVVGAIVLWCGLCGVPAQAALPEVLTRLDFHIVGLGLKAAPEYQAVPKGIATQVNTGFDAGDLDIAAIIAQLPQDYTVRAELSGPAYPTPRTLITRPGKPFDIPTLALLGKHTLANIRLVDANGTTLFGAMPQAVIIETINDPLITEVTTRPLTTAELQERGVTFDSSSFSAYQFTAAIATESGQMPINLPVLIPIRNDIYEPLKLPPPPSIGLGTPPEIQIPETDDMSISGFMLEMQVDEWEGASNLVLPPIPGVLVIPGNIGFLHQYFSALAIVSNGAPNNSNLTIRDVQARLLLPVGADLVAGSDAVPGDDPLRMAKSGSDYFPRTQVIVNAGADGQYGTSDDLDELVPAASGQADFTIEGLKEGMHQLAFEITATLDGLPIGPVQLKGRAKGAVLVRNPDFSVTLGHPATIRSGEAYDLFVTITNTGAVPANLVSLRLDPRALSGAVFAAGETPEKEIETILPNSSATIRYHLLAQRTGKVTAAAIASEEVRGSFILRAGVGEAGIPLSPESLILPYTGGLAPEVVEAAVGLLGQAWSVATAPSGALPADVLPIRRQIVVERANILSEAGLRLLLGDSVSSTAGDLTFDFFAALNPHVGFDSLRRRSTQGAALNAALGAVLGASADGDILALQAELAAQASWRTPHLSVALAPAALQLRITDSQGRSIGYAADNTVLREIPYADLLPLTANNAPIGALALVTRPDPASYRITLTAPEASSGDLGVVLAGADGVLRQVRFLGFTLAAGESATLQVTPGQEEAWQLAIDENADGVAERFVASDSVQLILDPPPQLIAATQVVPGFGPGGDKHGRSVAVLFSERVDKTSAEMAANYNMTGNSVRMAVQQAGGRIVFLLLRDGISPFVERSLSVAGIVDNRDQSLVDATALVKTTAAGPAATLGGTVRGADGAPKAGATVRLLQLQWVDDGIFVDPKYFIVSEKSVEANGAYHFDYVLQNDDPVGPFMIEAIDAASGEVVTLTTAVAYHGQQIILDLFMKARGSLTGRILDPAGRPVAGAQVLLMTLSDNRPYLVNSDAGSLFSFNGAAVGAFSLKAVSTALMSEGMTMGTLPEDGARIVQDVVIYPVASVSRGTVYGRVTGADGVTPRSGVVVAVEMRENGELRYSQWLRSDAQGNFSFAGVFAGELKVWARDDGSGERGEVTGLLDEDETRAFNIVMKGTGTISGKVVRADGSEPAGLCVLAEFGGLQRYVTVGAGGIFTLADLPIGTISLKVLDPGDGNQTLMSSSVSIVTAGEDVYAELFLSSCRIIGTAYRLDGSVAANVAVRLIDFARSSYRPFQSDSAGRFVITDLAPGTYPLAVVNGREVSNLWVTLQSAGQTREVALHPAGFGTISGTVFDAGSGMIPTGADVRLYGIKPDAFGWLRYSDDVVLAAVKSDPQNGEYSVNNVYAGSWTLRASNLLRPQGTAATGKVTSNNEALVADLVLKDSFGSLSGQVFLPGGIPAPAGVQVSVTSGGFAVTVTTAADGRYRFEPVLPAGSYLLLAVDQGTTLKVRKSVVIRAGEEAKIDLQLLGRGTLVVRVLDNDGTIAAGSTVAVRGSDFPNDTAAGTTDANATISLSNLSQGSYVITAAGSGNRSGRASATIADDGAMTSVDVRLAPFGTVIGTFFKADNVTPLGGAQIELLQGGRTIGYALSSSAPESFGRFTFDFIPLGDFTLEGYDPLSGRAGRGGGRLAINNETVTANLAVIPRGTVRGAVLNYSGTTPIATANVKISVAGVSSFIFETTAAPDGTFRFAGVPAGRYTLTAVDPATGLSGQLSGTLSYEGETLTTEVRLVATGSIAGQVFLPDGVTPAANVTVHNSTAGQTIQVDPAGGTFRFVDLPSGRSYALIATENNSNRAVTAIAALQSDGEVVTPQLVLRGIGSVFGTLYDSDALTPLTGGRIQLSAHGAVTASYSVFSDEKGAYRFDNVPVGTFTVSASHPQRVTAAAYAGQLGGEGENVSTRLVLGEIAAVVGRLLLADGVSVTPGGMVELTGSKGRFVAVTDAVGRFSVPQLPLGAYAFSAQDAAAGGIAKQSLTLAVNGETRDLGDIVLDDRPISVAQIDPAAGTGEVTIRPTIRIKFSEPAQADTLSAATIKLLKGATSIPCTLTPDTDLAGVLIAPNADLAGQSLYTVVVTTALRDRVGRPLAAAWSSTFTTLDNVAPTITAVSPQSGAKQIPVDAPLRITVSEPLDATSLGGVLLQRDGVTNPATSELIQNGTVVLVTAAEGLALNSRYTLKAAGLRDLNNNTQSTPWQSSFDTIDTFAPEVIALTVAADALLIQGQSVIVTASVAATDLAKVDFYRDEVLFAFDSSAPYNVALPLSETGTFQLKAIAQDLVGNRGSASLLAFEVANDQPPTVLFSAPSAGSLFNTGASLTVTLAGSDDLGVKEIVLTGSGATSFTQSRTGLSGKSATATFTVVLPIDANPAFPLTLTAMAKDSAGQNGIASERMVTVRDNIAPQGLTLSSDGQTTLYRPGTSGTLRLTASDNIGLVDASCTATRAGSNTQQWSYAPASKVISEIFTFNVAAEALKSDTIELSCVVHDAAGLAVQKSLVLGVADIHPPQVVMTSPVDGASAVPVRSILNITFDEALTQASITAATVRLLAPDNLPIAGMVTLGSDARTIIFTPDASLQRGSTYHLLIDGITDLAGNRSDPAVFSFTTDDGAPQVVATIPLDGDVGIQVGATLALRFAEAVDLASVTPRLSVTSPYGPVNGTISLSQDGATVYFKPFGLLAYNRAYSVALTAGVEDLSGNPQPDGFTFAFTTESPNPDLLGIWHFDGDFSDASGNGRDARASGAPALVDHGIIAQALSLDGDGESIDLGIWFDQQTFSVELWVNPGVTQSPNSTLFANNDGFAASWALQQEGSKVNTYQWLLTDDSAPIAVMIPPGAWSQLVLTRDGATRSSSLYLNGQLVGSSQGSGEIIYNGRQSLRIGPWSGALDEVAIFGVTLQAEDVRELFVAATSGDRIPPAAPTAATLPVSTSTSTILLSGSKEAESSIRVNGREIVSIDASTTWQAFYPLLPGENLLIVSSRDASGNSSEAIELYTGLLPAFDEDPSLFAYWPLDGNWLDYAGNNRHLTAAQGNAFSRDRAAGMAAASFTGGGYAVDATAGSQLTAASNFTVTGWIKPQALQSGGVIDLGMESASSWELWYDADARLMYQQNWSRAGMESFSTAAGSVPLDRWTHFAVVYAGREATIYLDGVASAIRTFNNDPIMDANAWLELGVHRPGSDEYFKGLLDDVTIRTRALSTAEVAALAAAPPTVMLIADRNMPSYRPGDVGQVMFNVNHPAGVEAIICTASGAAAGRVVQNPDGAVRSSGSLDFVVAAAARANAMIRIDCSARAAAGDVGSALLLLWVADLLPPVVSTTSVLDQAGDIVGVDPLTVTFDEELDPATVKGETVILFDGAGNPVAGRVTLSADGKTIIFTPLAVLPSGGSYRLVIGTGVTDRVGNRLATPVEIRFTTATANDLVITGKGSAAAPYTLAAGRYARVSIASSYVVVTGKLVADTLTITASSTVVHPVATASTTAKLEIMAGTLIIDAGSKIDVSGKGCLGANQPGNASAYGRTAGNTTTGGSYYYSGGSYGGSGGVFGSTNSIANAPYGSLYDPNDLGSGGGTSTNSSLVAGNGGGLVRIVADTLTLDGSIVADGGTTTYSGGSGGGIRLDVGSLSGSGTISARGGTSSSYGGGGGGRIAIYYDSLGLVTANINAAGGKSNNTSLSYSGGAGTVYLKDNAKARADLLINNGGVPTSNLATVPGGDYGQFSVTGGAKLVVAGDVSVDQDVTFVGSNLLFHGRLTVSGNLSLDGSSVTMTSAEENGSINATGIVSLKNGSILSHLEATTTPSRLRVTANVINIDAGSKIDVSGKGYLGANQPGNASAYGRTAGNTTTGGSYYYSGGSYGGSGGVFGSTNSIANAPYGSLYDPNDLGSGGGTSTNSSLVAGNGGGLVRIVADTLTLDGSIVADGGTTTYSGGSGGGIRLDVGSLSGSGTISAKGGAASNYGGGGGGRIAIYYDSLSLAATQITAAGGKSNSTGLSYSGGAGTVYLRERIQTMGSLFIDNGGIVTNRTTPIPCDIPESVVAQNGAVITRTGVCP